MASACVAGWRCKISVLVVSVLLLTQLGCAATAQQKRLEEFYAGLNASVNIMTYD